MLEPSSGNRNLFFDLTLHKCVAPSQTQLRKCVIKFGHIQWKFHCMFFPYHRGLLLKERIRSLRERILFFKRGPTFEKRTLLRRTSVRLSSLRLMCVTVSAFWLRPLLTLCIPAWKTLMYALVWADAISTEFENHNNQQIYY